jgi:hypothetical protein
VTASTGIWAQGDATGERVLYRWEAGQQISFVTFEVPTRRFRPSDDNGRPIGGLVYDAATGDSRERRLRSTSACSAKLSPRYLSSQMRHFEVKSSVVLGWLVDPAVVGDLGWAGSPGEALGVGGAGGVEGVLAGLVDGAGGREVDRGRGVPADPGMAVDVVVLGEEPVAERPGGLQVRE